MINTKKYSYSTNSGYSLIELKPNSKITHSVTSVGSISSDGSCDYVKNFKSNGRTYATRLTKLTITISEETARLNVDDKMLSLSNGNKFNFLCWYMVFC